MKRGFFALSCRCTLMIFVLLMANFRLFGQSVITNYTPSYTTAAGFTPITGGLTTTWTGTTDDGASALIPIGFDFWYMGTRYTNVSATTNGWLSMGVVPTDYAYANNLVSGGTRPVIAPLWDDLDIGSNSNVTYRTTGTAGSRIFTVQYLNAEWNYLSIGAVCSFQVNFYETTGKIEFVYRSDLFGASSPSASIGITGAATGSGNYLSINNAGTAVSSTSESSVTTKRVTGRTYGFTPPIPTVPGSLTFTALAPTSMTLNWTDLSINERGFVIYRSTDGVNYTFATQVAAGATSSIQSGLTTGITYYWRIYAVTEGGLSTALSGSQITSCTGPAISQLPATGLISNYKLEGSPADAAGTNLGTFQGGIPSASADRFNVAGKAITLNGTSNYISTTNSYVNPSSISISSWFKTTSTTGGALMGFSSLQTGAGGSRDRFLYMTNSGILYFAVAPGAVKKYISTTNPYNDGNWHQVTATLGAGGMKLYVDGILAASDLSVTTAETTTGYWRLGHSDISTWPNESSSYFFQGMLDDMVIYHRELSASEVGVLYNSPDGAGSNSPVCAGAALNLTATSVSGATYAWTGPNGFTSTQQNPTITYTAAYAGTYTVQVTAPGCAAVSTAYVNVTSTTAAGQWTGNVSTDWANALNWCNGVVPTATTDVIITSGVTNMPNISTSVACRNLTVNAGATVTLTGTGTLNIAGTLTNSGTFANTGTVAFNGTTGQQTFAGINSFYNLTVSNSTGLLLPSSITIANDLVLAAGVLNANNFNITIAGNWTNNASASAFAPGTGTVSFNSTTAKTIGGSVSTTFNNLTISNTANTVSLAVNIAISGNLTVNTGTLDLGAFTANRATAGGILTVANNATLKIGGTNTYPSNYSTNTLVAASTVEYYGASQIVANQTYGNLRLSGSSGTAAKSFPTSAMTIVGNLTSTLGTATSVTFGAGAALTVNGNVVVGASTTFSGNSFTITVGGNWANAGSFAGGTGTVVFAGPGTTVSGAGVQGFNNLTVSAPMVSFSAEGVTLSGNLATTGSGAFTQASGGTLTMTGAGTTISGNSISPDNLTITSPATVTTASSIIITGNLNVAGSFIASSGTITMSGASKIISGSGTKTFSILSITGTVTTAVSFTVSSGLIVYGSLTASGGTATFTGTSSLSGTANLFSVTINGTSLQLSANAILGVAGALTLTSGTLNVSSTPNTVNFNGSGAQTINAITYNNLIFSTGGTKTAAGAITVNNDITIGTGTTFTAGNFTHSIYNNWYNNGTFTAGSGTVQILGTQNSVISGATTFNILTINTTSAAVGVTLLNNVTVATVNMTSGTMYTGANTLTMTVDRTGPGIILGTITRAHSFGLLLSGYAFESPQNTITFTLALGVSNVTVSVVLDPPGDFPSNASIKRTYTVTIPNSISLIGVMRFHYEDNELNGNNEATMTAWRNNGTGWVSNGKTSNDPTTNYVETVVPGTGTYRWTLSDAQSVIQWTGATSSDWNTASNWSPASVPGPSNTVNIGTAAFTNQPAISTAVTVKNINFGSVQAATLSMNTGGSLTTSDIRGIWSANATHIINVNAQTVNINGDLSLSDGTAGRAINLNIGTGTVNITGSLTQRGNANVVFAGAGNLTIGGNFNYTNGTFTPSSGTVTYNGTSNQVVAAVPYNNLVINKTTTGATAIATGALTINGNLTISAGELDSDGANTVIGNVTVVSGAVYQNNSTVTVGGNWNNSGSFISNTSGTGVIFNGSGAQSISATTFNNLEFNKPVGTVATLTGNVTIKGNLTGTSGTLDIQSFVFNRDVQGGTATLSDASTLIIGANNAPNKFSSYALSTNSTVVFNGTGAQSLLLPGLSYGNLTFRNAGTKTLSTAINVKNNLTIENTAVVDGSSNTVTIGGNWLNNGSFVPSTGAVIFTGGANSITGNTTFNKVTIAGTYTIFNNVTFNGLLEITASGSLNGGSGITTTLNADLTNRGTLNTLGITTFTGNVLQTLSLINAVSTVAATVNFNGTVSPVLNSTSPPQFATLNINNTGGVNPSVGWNIATALTVGTGASFNGGSSTHTLLGTLTNNGTITSTGILNFTPSAAALINMGTNFTSTGTVVFGGAGAITLAGNPGSLRNVFISNTNVAGVSSVSNLTLTNNLTILNGSIFNAGSYTYVIGGNLANNGTINSGTSTFNLNGATVQNINSVSPLYNLVINNGAGTVTVSTNVTINNVLTFTAGKIQTGNYTVIQPASGTVSGAAQATGWVYGKLQKNTGTGTVTKTFEIGNQANYLPVSVGFANVSVAGNLMVSTTEGDHPSVNNSMLNPALTVNRYWTLSNSGIVFSTAAVTYNYLASDVDSGAVTSAFVLAEYSNSAWTYPMVNGLTATSLTASGITSFADFQIGQMAISIKTWDGGAGTSNWGDAANWNTDGVPTVNDNVELTGPYIININVPAVTKNLLLSNPGLVLSTVGANTLSVSGNMTLASGTFNMAGAFPTITGLIDFSAGTVGFTGTVSQTIPALNYYNLVSSSTGPRVFASSGIIGVYNSFTSGINAYTVTGSTVSYNGESQTVASSVYNNLSLDNRGMKTFAAGTTRVAGNLTVAGTVTTDAVTNVNTVSYNGTANQIVTDIPYYNLDGSNPSGVVMLTDASVKNVLSVSAGSVQIGNSATVRKVTASGGITVASGATFTIATTSDAKHNVNIGGDLVSNGVFDMTADANSLGSVNFVKDGNQLVSGSGTADFNDITLNQGSNSINTLDVTTAGFTAPAGFLTLRNGTFKLNNASVNVTLFTADITTGAFLIPASAGLWVNAGTVSSTAMNWTIGGLVKVSGGTLNMGNAANNVVIPKNQAQFSISGGTLNTASAISNPGVAWRFEMQDGTVNVNTLGSTAGGIAPFNMDTAASVFNVTGGRLVVQNSGGTAGQNLGYQNISTGGTGFTGGTLQMGNASTSGTQTMLINTVRPLYNLEIGSANVTIPLTINDLTVSNNVTVTAGTLNINSRVIKIGGGISNNGSFIASSGTVEMNGSAAQSIPAAAFTGNLIRNLTVTNTAGVNLGGALSLTEILKVNTGTFNASGNLTLVSSIDKTALIDGSGAGNVSGNINMQRYLVAGFGYKYFSSPVQNATVGSFAATVDLNASFANFYKYEENKVSSGFTTYTNPASPLIPLEGYAADFGPSPVQKTVSISGIANNGALSVTLYNHNQPYTKGFNLVGNPYPSPINWDASSGWTKTNIDNALYFFNSGTTSQYTGAYSTYINGVSSDGVAGPIIASMQGFFVHVSDGGYPVAGTLGINNSTRTTDLSPVFHKSTFRVMEPPPGKPRVLVRVSANFTDTEKSADPLVVYTSDSATPEFNGNVDAIKLMNIDEQTPSIYSIREDTSKKMAINAITEVDSTMVIPVGIKTERDGKVSFNLRDLENWPTYLNLYLRDAETGINHDLQNNEPYIVELKKGTVENRFSLVCFPAGGNSGEDIFIAYGKADDMYVRIKLEKEQMGTLSITNLLGQQVSSMPVSGNGDYKLQGLTVNVIYFVTLSTPKGNHTLKILTAER
ncbi:LamG domain-containing protein [Flavobacterium sp. DG1-102-2]|uniref:LamG domain-containing protein n=1 Tax=Flavobacterium sp. DG1-102-2 TaxID=3081663 RepID=UPI00294A0920|nr:LamG domain-containing protein [Flavobacterium sp. DG1-102-2]MDV6166925.1 LamG domain-containing protein [Flavobacterium sp. DG1-102-2]